MTTAQNKYKNFADQKQLLSELMGQSADVIAALNMHQNQEGLNALQGKVGSESFKIMVVGTFKNGKSTFINSFLGDDILPAYSIPCTAVINEVKYGQEKKAVLYFRDPLPERLPMGIPEKTMAHIQNHGMKNVPPMEIPYDEIEDYVVIPMGSDPTEMLLESPYEKVELFWPLELLKNGVEIIDSPGLNEHATRTRVTMEYLTKADAILMVMNAQVLCSEKEMEFVENDLQAQGFSDPFFVVNRFDCIPPREQGMVKKFATVKLQNFTRFGADGIYFVSAREALDGKQSGNAEQCEASGMPHFENDLSDFLIRHKGIVKLAQPAREVRRILNEEALIKAIPMQRQMLTSNLDEIKARYNRVKPKLTDLTTRKEQLYNGVMLRIEQCRSEFRRVVNRNYLDLISDSAGWIDEYKIKTAFSPVPKKTQVEAAVKEISEYIVQKLNDTQKQWRQQVLTPMITEKAASIFDDAQKSVAAILNEVNNIHMEIARGKDEDATQLQRAVNASGNLSLDIPSIALKGGMDSIIKGLGIYVGTFSAVTLLTTAFNPFALIATVVGLLIWGSGESKTEKKLKTALKEEITKQMELTAEQTVSKTVESIIGKYIEIVGEITAALDDAITEVDTQAKTIIQEMEKGEEYVAQREAVIAQCEASIHEITAKLDALTTQLAKE